MTDRKQFWDSVRMIPTLKRPHELELKLLREREGMRNMTEDEQLAHYSRLGLQQAPEKTAEQLQAEYEGMRNTCPLDTSKITE